jgi:hypothetical protein
VSRLNAYRNLSWLLKWTENMPYPLYTVTASATRLQDDTWFGGINDDRTVMPRFADSRIGAGTKKQMEVFFERAIGKESPTITPVTQESLRGLLESLKKLHANAYDWSPTFDANNLIKQIGSQPIRTYIRGALEYLDQQYVYKECVDMEAEELIERELEEDLDYGLLEEIFKEIEAK